MNKKRNNALIVLANSALMSKPFPVGMLQNGSEIQKNYNGQVAAFGVAVAMSGLLPALAIYYMEGSEKREVKRRAVLEVIAEMIRLDDSAKFQGISDAKSLLDSAIKAEKNPAFFRELQNEVIDCSIALKQVVRTYNLV